VISRKEQAFESRFVRTQPRAMMSERGEAELRRVWMVSRPWARHMLAADRVSGLGILAEGLNHHLRNALTVVRAFIDSGTDEGR
jgi:hypothetical protein